MPGLRGNITSMPPFKPVYLFRPDSGPLAISSPSKLMPLSSDKPNTHPSTWLSESSLAFTLLSRITVEPLKVSWFWHHPQLGAPKSHGLALGSLQVLVLEERGRAYGSLQLPSGAYLRLEEHREQGNDNSGSRCACGGLFRCRLRDHIVDAPMVCMYCTQGSGKRHPVCHVENKALSVQAPPPF